MNDTIAIAALHSLGAIGQPVRRKEDQRLLTGRGRFSDDFALPGQAYAAIVRSPYPHARIVRIDVAASGGDAGSARASSPARIASPTGWRRSRTARCRPPATT